MGKQISIIGAVLWYHMKNSWEEAWVKLDVCRSCKRLYYLSTEEGWLCGSAYIHKFFIALERAQHLIHARQVLSHLRYNLSPLFELFIFKEGS